MATAHSNTATDNLLEGLLKLNVNAVRLGRPANVRSGLWNHTLDAKLLSHPTMTSARARLDMAVDVYRELKAEGVKGEDFGMAQRMLTHAKKRVSELEEQCITQILKEADVVVSTCIGAGGETLSNFIRSEDMQFATVLIDEAAQCMESASLPTLVLGCQRLILIGDQNQLPPVVASPVALEYGLGVSLFSRLAAGGLTPILLTDQYRMHPKIAEFSSEMFYGGRVKSRVEPQARPLPQGFRWPNKKVPVIFIDVSPVAALGKEMGKGQGQEPVFDVLEYAYGTSTAVRDKGSDERRKSDSKGGDERGIGATAVAEGEIGHKRLMGFERMSNATQASYYNDAEVTVVLEILEGFVKRGVVSLSDIGVISPYNAQVRR